MVFALAVALAVAAAAVVVAAVVVAAAVGEFHRCSASNTRCLSSASTRDATNPMPSSCDAPPAIPDNDDTAPIIQREYSIISIIIFIIFRKTRRRREERRTGCEREREQKQRERERERAQR